MKVHLITMLLPCIHLLVPNFCVVATACSKIRLVAKKAVT